jgi:hypothetical protein
VVVVVTVVIVGVDVEVGTVVVVEIDVVVVDAEVVVEAGVVVVLPQEAKTSDVTMMNVSAIQKTPLFIQASFLFADFRKSD